MTSELKVDKITPASGTSGTFGDSGDTFQVPSGVTLDIASGATLDATGATVTGISGGLVYVGGLNTTTEAASVAVDNVFTATYDNYLVVIESIRMKTTGGGLDFNWRTGGSSGSKVSGGNYRYALFGYRSDNGNSTSRYASSGGETRLTHGCVNDAETVGLSGYLHVADPFTSRRVRFTGNYTYMADAAGELRSMSGGSEYRDNIQATGFMFTGFGGTADDDIVEAQIKVYGVVNS